jgi:pimeloyl-ACP methyl ester carboxylesterase
MSVLAGLLRALAAFVIVWELLAYAIRFYEVASSGEKPDVRRGLANTVGLFLFECASFYAILVTGPLGFFWPFPAPPKSSRPPLLLVHGYFLTRASLLVLAWRLRSEGFPVVIAANYKTVRGEIHETARRLGREIDTALAASGHDRVHVVAHGLGGLVARTYLRDRGADARIHRLVTLGTPHQGTKVAVFAFDPLARELRPGSRLLSELAREDPVPSLTEVTSIFSPFDALVLPPRNAYYHGAGNVEVNGIGHHALLFSPKVFRLLVESLTDGTEAPFAGRASIS